MNEPRVIWVFFSCLIPARAHIPNEHGFTREIPRRKGRKTQRALGFGLSYFALFSSDSAQEEDGEGFLLGRVEFGFLVVGGASQL